MANEEMDALQRKGMVTARVMYTVRVLDGEWEEDKLERRISLDSQGAIERLLELLDQDDEEAKNVSVVPEALVPSRCFIVEGFYCA